MTAEAIEITTYNLQLHPLFAYRIHNLFGTDKNLATRKVVFRVKLEIRLFQLNYLLPLASSGVFVIKKNLTNSSKNQYKIFSPLQPKQLLLHTALRKAKTRTRTSGSVVEMAMVQR